MVLAAANQDMQNYKSVTVVVNEKWYFPATNTPLIVTTTVYKYFEHLVSAGNIGTFDVMRWNRREWTAGSRLKTGILGSIPSDCQLFTFLYVPLLTSNMSLVDNNSQWLHTHCSTWSFLHSLRAAPSMVHPRSPIAFARRLCKETQYSVTAMYTLKHTDW